MKEYFEYFPIGDNIEIKTSIVIHTTNKRVEYFPSSIWELVHVPSIKPPSNWRENENLSRGRGGGIKKSFESKRTFTRSGHAHHG